MVKELKFSFCTHQTYCHLYKNCLNYFNISSGKIIPICCLARCK